VVSRNSFLAFVAILLVAAVLGLILDDSYLLRIGTYSAIYSIVAIGLNLLFGNAGQISLGHGGFFAIGAYGAAVLMKNFHLPFLAALILSAIIAGLVGVLIGYIALRLKGHYLAMATLAFAMIVFGLLVELDYFGSTSGITGIPPISLFGHDFTDPRGIYLFTWGVVGLVYLVSLSLLSSRVGRALMAIRGDDLAAETLGIDVARYKIQVFAVSAFFTGIAGAIYAAYMALINPFSFNPELSINLLLMVVVGGLGSIPGSVLGVAVLQVLPEFGRQWENFRLAGYGILLVLLVIFAPGGIAGLLALLFRFLGNTFRSRKAVPLVERSTYADR